MNECTFINPTPESITFIESNPTHEKHYSEVPRSYGGGISTELVIKEDGLWD